MKPSGLMFKKCGACGCGLVLFALNPAPMAHANDGFDPVADCSATWTREQKAWALNLGLAAGVTCYGISQWGWGESAFSFKNEGWFGSHTDSGGADKLGHAFTGAAITALSASLYRHWNYAEDEAAILGALSGILTTTIIEVGDGFSDEHGFSWEDQTFNIAGVGLEYLRQRYPEIRQRVQFRWEYFPSSNVRSGDETDIFTDYEGSRWMLAFPLRAWIGEDTCLDWFEVLVGYGTRGYDDSDRGERHPFVGIGIHLPLVKEKLGIRGPGRILEHLQVPGTAWPLPP